MSGIAPDLASKTRRALAEAAVDKVKFAKLFFGYDLTPKQEEAVELGGKVSIKCAGRRFGKSTTSNVDLLHTCITKPRAVAYVVGPSIDQAQIYFDEIERAVDVSPLLAAYIDGEIVRRPFPELRLKNGSIIRGRSTAYDGKYLRGKGADIVAVTEAAFVKDSVYQEVIRALVLDRNGRILLESTPNGHNYFYNLYQHGLQDTSGYYKAFHATVRDNTRLSLDEISRIETEIPEIAFRVEYLAEFVDDDTFVFPWSVLQGVLEDYTPTRMWNPEHRYIIGVDLAKLRDYTVVTVLDTGPPNSESVLRIAEWHRMQQVKYADIADFVNELQSKYQARVFLDATGVGEAVQEGIENCEPIVFTAKTREDLLTRLVVTVEQRKIALPAANIVLRDELRYFQRQQHGQTIRAEASKGYHDDAVFSLALAVWGATEDPWSGIREYIRATREKIHVPERRETA